MWWMGLWDTNIVAGLRRVPHGIKGTRPAGVVMRRNRLNLPEIYTNVCGVLWLTYFMHLHLWAFAWKWSIVRRNHLSTISILAGVFSMERKGSFWIQDIHRFIIHKFIRISFRVLDVLGKPRALLHFISIGKLKFLGDDCLTLWISLMYVYEHKYIIDNTNREKMPKNKTKTWKKIYIFIFYLNSRKKFVPRYAYSYDTQ